MKYTALITYYNSPNPVLAINSALAQTIKPTEIVIVDDCSSETFRKELEETARSFGCIYMRTPTNLGPAGARNLGIENATTNIIMVFDDDDVSLPNRAKIHLENLRLGSQLSYVSSQKVYRNQYSFDALNHPYRGEIKASVLSRYLLSGNRSSDFPDIFVPACCLALRKDLFETNKIFDEKFRRLEDVDLAIRASEKGLVFSFSEEVGVIRYESGGSDKSALAESTAQIQILSKYKFYFKEREYRKINMWYRIRSYYFSGNYFLLLITGFTFTLHFGIQMRKIHNGLMRIIHDIRKRQKGNSRG